MKSFYEYTCLNCAFSEFLIKDGDNKGEESEERFKETQKGYCCYDGKSLMFKEVSLSDYCASHPGIQLLMQDRLEDVVAYGEERGEYLENQIKKYLAHKKRK